MYPNLRAEMARKNFTAEEMAKKIGRTNGTFSFEDAVDWQKGE